MKGFSATKTAFRIALEHPRAIAVWAVLQFGIALAVNFVLVTVGGSTVTEFLRLTFSGRPVPSHALFLLGELAPLYALLTVFTSLAYVVILAAISRAVLRPEENRLGFLRLGADEFRQLGVALLYGLGLTVTCGVGAIAFMFLWVIAFVAGPFGPPLFLAAFFALLLGPIYLACRLSLASPLTFHKNRIQLFESWRLTKGQVWPMLWAYILAAILAAAAMLLGFVAQIAVAVAIIGGSSATSIVLTPDLTTLGTSLTPARLVVMALGAMISAIVLPILTSPAAAIYKAITNVSAPESVF